MTNKKTGNGKARSMTSALFGLANGGGREADFSAALLTMRL